jgi:hypothetical protein
MNLFRKRIGMGLVLLAGMLVGRRRYGHAGHDGF